MALTGVQLQLPAAAALHGVELRPGQILGIFAIHPSHVDEHHSVETQPAQDPVAARPGIGAGVVEGQQQRMGWEADVLPAMEAHELVESDRLVLRGANSTICFANSSGSTP